MTMKAASSTKLIAAANTSRHSSPHTSHTIPHCITGQRGGHRDDGDDQAVEVSGVEGAGLEVIIADPRRSHPRGPQGEHGAG